MKAKTIIASSFAAILLFAVVGCGGGKKDAECKNAVKKARACIAEVCKDPKTGAHMKKTWCGDKTPLDNPVVAECPAPCAKAFNRGAKYAKKGDSCKRTLNGFENASTTSMCSAKKK